MTGIIGAMQIEVDALIKRVENATLRRYSGIDFISGKIHDNEVVVARCGVGKVFAAVCAQTMILEYHVDRIVNTGISGTLCDKLNIMDIAVAEAVVQHDMDTSALGDPVGMISGINIIKIPTSGSLSESILESARRLGIKTEKVTIASGDSFICSREKKQAIRATFDACVCDMESAAIGQVCYINNTEFAIVRTVSDSADGSSPKDYQAFAESAAHQSVAVLLDFLG